MHSMIYLDCGSHDAVHAVTTRLRKRSLWLGLKEQRLLALERKGKKNTVNVSSPIIDLLSFISSELKPRFPWIDSWVGGVRPSLIISSNKTLL